MGIRCNTSKTEAVVLSQKSLEWLLQVRNELLLQMEEYLGVCEGRKEWEIDRWIKAVTVVMQMLHRSFVLKR